MAWTNFYLLADSVARIAESDTDLTVLLIGSRHIFSVCFSWIFHYMGYFFGDLPGTFDIVII